MKLRRRAIGAILKQALSGVEHDFTQGNLSSAIALLAIPTMLEMAMESSFALVDAFWVAKLGADAMAVTGLTESIVVLLYVIAIGLAAAAGATVARRIGEKDAEGASVAAAQIIALGIGAGIAMGIAGAHFAPQLLSLMDASPNVLRIGTTYARILLGANIVIPMLFLINSIFRAA